MLNDSAVFYATNADEAVDVLVAANTSGKPLFYQDEDGNSFVNSELLMQVYSSLAVIGVTGSQMGTTELLNTAYVLAALDARSRGNRLLDEMKKKVADFGL